MPIKTIFLAESENHVRSALRLALEQQESICIIGEASYSDSLLAQVCQSPPDAILLDSSLPGLHPLRLLPALRQCCPETLIIATGVRQDQENSVMDQGIDGFLSKQLPPCQFISQLREMLKKTVKNTRSKDNENRNYIT